MRRRLALLALLPLPALAAPFEVSDSYAARPDLVAGTYACRSGLDIDSFTWTFDIADGAYLVRGDYPEGAYGVDAEGTVDFRSGPFAPDATAEMLGRSVTRVSDGNPTIVLGYFFADGATAWDFCARLD